jgi:putative transposase
MRRKPTILSPVLPVLGVARAGYYAWACRPLSQRTVADQALTDQIRQIHAPSRGTYGAPRIHAELRLGLEVRVGRKRVARLMRAGGIVGVHRRRRHGLTRRDPAATPALDLVERNFTPPAPDRLWVADFERHEALSDRAVMEGHRRRPVAAGRLKLRAA